MVCKDLLPVKSLMASKKNNTVSVEKITCNKRFSFNVPMNMNKVNMPHNNKYQPTAVSLDLYAAPNEVLGISHNATSDSQNEPYAVKAVAPKVLFFFHSCRPAKI